MSCTIAADLGFRSDSSAAAVVRAVGRRFVLVDYLEQRPTAGKPLQPSVVLGAIAKLAVRHQCGAVWSDFHYSETAKEELAKNSVGLSLGPAGATGKVEVWTTARALILEGRVFTPNVPGLLAQLKLVRSKPTAGGGLSIEQPRRAGSHGDLAAAFALALWAANAHPAFDYAYTPAPDYRHDLTGRHRAPGLRVDRGGMVHWGSDGPEYDDDDD